jgi:hypothetical protein
MVDACTGWGKYEEPGLWGAADCALAGTGVAASTLGVADGVTDLEIWESTDDGRWDSAWRSARRE